MCGDLSIKTDRATLNESSPNCFTLEVHFHFCFLLFNVSANPKVVESSVVNDPRFSRQRLTSLCYVNYVQQKMQNECLLIFVSSNFEVHHEQPYNSRTKHYICTRVRFIKKTAVNPLQCPSSSTLINCVSLSVCVWRLFSCFTILDSLSCPKDRNHTLCLTLFLNCLTANEIMINLDTL